MSKIDDTKSIAAKKPGIASSAIACMLLALVFGCGDPGTAPVYIGPGTGGSAGSGGSGGSGGASGMGGIGGTGGTGAMAGTGGTSGSGGAAGTGGTGSTGGTGGTGGVATKSICRTPLDADFCESSGNCCETNLDCAFAGYVCVDSGCKTDAGAPIKQCQPSRGGSCVDEEDCPNPSENKYGCIAVGGGPKRCVRDTPGCDAATETYDCPPGFSCEGSACVDRRMPCDSYLDCPKSHVCTTTPSSRYCIRTHRSCNEDTDCGGFAAVGSFCANVDNHGTKECVGELDDSGVGCVNADCGGSTPVCEIGDSLTAASCGDYGLCRTNNDCDVADGFECVGLWQDGRKECVQTGDTCDRVTDCDPQQVCAAPRSGGPLSCQSGSAP